MGCSICLPEVKTCRILFLDSSGPGETTQLYCTKLQDVINIVPDFDKEVFEFGEPVQSQEAWNTEERNCNDNSIPCYMSDVVAVVFLIDCDVNNKKYSLAVRCLDFILGKNELRNCPLAIAVSRQDLGTGIVSAEKITNDLSSKGCLQNRFWKVFSISSLTGDGFSLLLQWVNQHIRMEGIMRNKPQVTIRRRKRKVAHSSIKQQVNDRDEFYRISEKRS